VPALRRRVMLPARGERTHRPTSARRRAR
jgi:hypothetical protein